MQSKSTAAVAALGRNVEFKNYIDSFQSDPPPLLGKPPQNAKKTQGISCPESLFRSTLCGGFDSFFAWGIQCLCFPTRKTVQFRREKCPNALRGQSRPLIRLAGGRLAIPQANRTHSGQFSDDGWLMIDCGFASSHSKSNFLTLSSVMSHRVPSRIILSLPEDGIKGTPYSLQSS